VTIRRAVIVEGPLLPSQAAHWSAFADLDVDLHMVGGLSAPGDDWWTTGKASDIATHVIRPRGWVTRGQHWWIYPGLSALIKRLKPDVVHVGAEPWGLFYSQVLPGGIPTVGHGADNIWVHGSPIETKIRITRARSILKRLSGYVSWNTAGIRLARKFGLPVERPTLVAPNRIPDPQSFEDAARRRDLHRAELGITDKTVVGFVGRLVPEKGLGWLIAALAEAHLPNTLLLAVGSGPQQPRYERMTRELGVAAHFTGGINPDRMPAMIASCDVLVVPSLTTPAWAEQFGRVVTEAMFAHTPVISSDSGSLPEVVGDTGLLVKEADQSQLADAIRSLVTDRDLRHSLGERGWKRSLEEYGPAPLARRILAFWNDAAGVP